MDSDAKAAFLALCELCRKTMKCASESRLSALRIHEALVKARVPGYLEAYESSELHFPELERIKRELEDMIDAIGKATK